MRLKVALWTCLYHVPLMAVEIDKFVWLFSLSINST